VSIISDALRTEILYLDGNPDYIVPASTFFFLKEAAEEIEAHEIMRKRLVDVAESYRMLILSDYEGRNGINSSMKEEYDLVLKTIAEATGVPY